ncbi:MAG: RNA polymerase factor sigma-54 [Bacteroidetes bacterium]|nr:RNA polymerase factor sigma-54 [Bacteroidota bacterium]
MSNLKLFQNINLRQKLSPHQIQSYQFLQLNVLELERQLKTELIENPFLEESIDTISLNDEDPINTENEFSNTLNDFENYLLNDKAEEDSILSQLRTQLNFLNLTEKQLLIADEIIGNIDGNGYLNTSLDIINENLKSFEETINISNSDIEHVLHIIQRLDPLAIGSRNLQECLLIQLHFKSHESHVAELAEKVIKNYFDLFSQKHYEEISRKLKISVSIMKKIIDVINSLNPKPGESSLNPSLVIIPDVIIRQFNDKIVITINESTIPKLKLRKDYYDAIDNTNKESKEFYTNKYTTAKIILNALESRKFTLLKVANQIVKHQNDYFISQGPLKPLSIKKVAENLNLDESTINRVVQGKYAQTDYGVFPLRYFFSIGVHSINGEEISSNEILNRISEIIKTENSQKPLSDDKIHSFIEKDGLNISRRVITKYRQKLHIPIARLRKKL